LLAGLASDQPVPAGGSAVAAVVAAAAALLEKASRLSLAHWVTAEVALEQAHALRLRAEELIEADADAYMSYVEAVRSAKALHGKTRERAIAPARALTIDVPLAITRLGAEAVELAGALADHGNPNLRADATVAATIAAAAATAAARLIAFNIRGTARDPRLEEATRIALAASDKAARMGGVKDS
jgi:formiminotetrahydrofolate cyclodeaminase